MVMIMMVGVVMGVMMMNGHMMRNGVNMNLMIICGEGTMKNE